MNTNEIKNTNTTNTKENTAVQESTAAQSNMTSETLYSEIPPISVEGADANDGISVMCVGGGSDCHDPDCTCPDCEEDTGGGGNGNIPVTSVTVSTSTKNMLLNSWGYIGANISPSNATNPEVTWRSTNTGVVTAVKDSVGCKLTAVGEGSALVIATTTDGTNLSDGCLVTVTKDNTVYVTSVTLPTPTMTLTVGDTKTLTATVEPSDATNKTLSWSSSDNTIASVTQAGIVTAEAVGRATITVTSTDGSDVYDSVYVNVILVPVSSVSVSPEQITMRPGETATIAATVSPCDASDKTVEWMSSNVSVATVEADTGVVTARSDGSATITATTFNGNKTDTCTVNVDSRERVTIRKDSHSFYVEFADGNVWKNIGMDLSKRSDHYSELYPPEFIYENYPYLIEEEQRYFDNIYVANQTWEEFKSYSVKQIAYLYLFDPLGIEYYMRNHACKDISYKDEVYEAIFGTTERSNGKFYFKVVDGEARYGKYSDCSRGDIYSNAEVMFGFHTIINWDYKEFIKSVLEGLFMFVISEYEDFEDSIITQGLEAYQMLFHAGGIIGACSDEASSYIQKHVEANISEKLIKKYGEAFRKRATKTVHWTTNLIVVLVDSALGAFEIPNPLDITIYNRVYAQPEYLAVLEGFDEEVTLKDIIDKVNQN